MIRFIVLILLLSGCAVSSKSGSLYQEMGGAEALEQIVDDFIINIANDEQIFHYFAESNVSHFRAGFIQHICAISDGPCHYAGDNMVDIHTGMNITEADFNRVVELLVAALEKNQISYQTQNKLLARLAPMREDVYQR